MLPRAHEAAAWFVDTVRAALAAGGRLDLDTVMALRCLAPADPIVGCAVDRLDAAACRPDGAFASRARYIAAALRVASEAHDEERARELVDDLETDLLAVFRPGQTLGTFEDDVATSSVLLDCWELGGQLPHAMMAEELLLIMQRVYWPTREQVPFAARAEAARSLLRLFRTPQGKAEYYDNGIALLRELSPDYRQHGLQAAAYVLALHLIS